MTQAAFVVALSLAALPLPVGNAGTAGAPPGDPNTRYCLRVDPPTGSRIETIQCMTREEWAGLDVNVDAEWAQNGVRVIA
jgi:hypothetical protein